LPLCPTELTPVYATDLCTVHAPISSAICPAVLAPLHAANDKAVRATNVETKCATVLPAVLGTFKSPLDELPVVRAVDAAQLSPQWIPDHTAFCVAYHATFEPAHSSSVDKAKLDSKCSALDETFDPAQ